VALHLLHDLPPIVCGCMFGSARASSTGLKWSAEPLPSVASHGTSIFHHSFPGGCSASNSLLVMIVHSRPAHVDVALYHTSQVLNPSRSGTLLARIYVSCSIAQGILSSTLRNGPRPMPVTTFLLHQAGLIPQGSRYSGYWVSPYVFIILPVRVILPEHGSYAEKD
jgi:hypothetical protein